MTPNCKGIWEWFEVDGTKRLVEVVEVANGIANGVPSLAVYWWGGYYNVSAIGTGPFEEAEWPDRWGNRVGDNNSLPAEQLYLIPTPEEQQNILITQYENSIMD